MKGQVQHFSHIGNVVCNCCFIWTRLKLIDPYSNWFVGNLVLKNIVCNCCFIWTRLKLIEPYSNWFVGNLVLKNVVCNCCFIWTRLKLIDPYSNWLIGNLVLKKCCSFISPLPPPPPHTHTHTLPHVMNMTDSQTTFLILLPFFFYILKYYFNTIR